MQEDGDALELQPLRSDEEVVKKVPYGVSDDDEYRAIDESVDPQKDKSFSWKEYFFPSNLPDEVQLLRWENLAIPACYLLVGTMQGLFRPLLNVYPLDLRATEAQQTTLSTIATLPAAFKIVYGFLSDNIAIAGLRRKPYMLAGWLVASLMMVVLMLSSDLSLTRENGQVFPPENAPSVQFLSVSFFLFGTGMWFADVMADSLVAQKAPLEPEEVRGSLQSSCYASRFFGLMLSAPISTCLYSRHGPGSVISCLMVGPLLMLPLIYLLAESRNVPVKSTAEQCCEIWKTVCMRSVWQPLGFMYVFNLLQVSNAAWRQYLKSVLGFTAAELNILLVASYVLLYMGTITYKFFFLHTSWRRLYQVCILLNGFFSSLQLLLIRGHTLGLSPFLFALGDDAFAEFITGIQFLPCTILMVSLCPPGSEGTSYAMFTTVWNSAMMLAPAISSVLLSIWDVSKPTLEAGNLDGLFNLSILTTIIQMSPVLFIGWLPHRREDLYALSEKPSGTSSVGGAIFLAILFGSMLYTFTVAILNIVRPGWAGES